jgi:hypothetical protein
MKNKYTAAVPLFYLNYFGCLAPWILNLIIIIIDFPRFLVANKVPFSFVESSSFYFTILVPYPFFGDVRGGSVLTYNFYPVCRMTTVAHVVLSLLVVAPIIFLCTLWGATHVPPFGTFVVTTINGMVRRYKQKRFVR